MIFFSAALWGTAGIFVRNMSSSGLHDMQIVTLRTFFAALCIAGIILIKGGKLFRIRLRDLPIFAAAGIFSIVLFTFCYYRTMALSTLAVAAVLLYTAPIFVILISALFFHEKLTLGKCAACVISFIGCALVSGISGDTQLSPACIIYGLLTGFGYSLYTIFGNILVRRGYQSLTVTFYTFLFAAAGSMLLENPVGTFTTALSAPPALYWAIGMAVFNTVIPYIFYTVGLTTVEAGRAPIIATVEPVVAALVGIFLFREPTSVQEIIGIVLVLGAILLLQLGTGKKQDNPSA